MDQMSRTATLDAFREGRITLLAASDVAARGLDIPDVSHIFNFDVPWQIRRLRAPHRPHGPGGQGRPLADARHARRFQGSSRTSRRCWAPPSPGSAKRRARRTSPTAASGAAAVASGAEAGRPRSIRGARQEQRWPVPQRRPHRPERHGNAAATSRTGPSARTRRSRLKTVTTSRNRVRSARPSSRRASARGRDRGEQEPQRHREARHGSPARSAADAPRRGRAAPPAARRPQQAPAGRAARASRSAAPGGEASAAAPAGKAGRVSPGSRVRPARPTAAGKTADRRPWASATTCRPS